MATTNNLTRISCYRGPDVLLEHNFNANLSCRVEIPPELRGQIDAIIVSVVQTRERSKFRRGSGCYTCHVCGRKTRATGNGNESADLCAECFDQVGCENTMSDCGETPALLAERQRYIDECIKKGGKPQTEIWWTRRPSDGGDA